MGRGGGEGKSTLAQKCPQLLFHPPVWPSLGPWVPRPPLPRRLHQASTSTVAHGPPHGEVSCCEASRGGVVV